MQVNTKEILLNPLFKGLTHCATLSRYRPSTVWTVCRNHTAQPRTSAQPHLGTSLGTSARDSESPPTLTTGGATWLIPCKFHDNNTRPAAPQQPVPAVVMTECGGVVIEIICRKIFCGQQINCTNTARLTSHRWLQATGPLNKHVNINII